MIDPSDHRPQFIDLLQACGNNKSVRTSLKFNQITVSRHLHAYLDPPVRTISIKSHVESLESSILQSLEEMYQQQNTFSSSSTSSPITTMAWPNAAFRQSCQASIPTVQNDFAPCFFKYPTLFAFINPSSPTPAIELDWPESIDELNDPIAWPSQVVAAESVRVQVEALAPRSPRFDQSKQFQVKQNIGTTAAWCASPVGMDHIKIDATTGKPMGGVVLNACVKSRTLLHSYCNDFLHRSRVHEICPSNQWASGAQIQHSLLTGWHHGMTRSYTVGHDAGASSVQVQVHNVVGGTCSYLGLPRSVSFHLAALYGATKTFIEHHTEANWVQEQTPLGVFVQVVQQKNREFELHLLNQLSQLGMLEAVEAEAEEVRRRMWDCGTVCGTVWYCVWYCGTVCGTVVQWKLIATF